MASEQNNIDDLLLENRKFPPPVDFQKNALVAGTHLYDEARADDEGFWARQAADLLHWDTDWHTICEWNLPYAKWFVGGKLNVSYNCLDRHVLAGRGDKVAFYWEGEPGDARVALGPAIRANLAAGHTVTVSSQRYFALSSPVARRIYRLVELARVQGNRTWRIGLERLADQLPLVQRYPSHLQRVLQPAHEMLVAADHPHADHRHDHLHLADHRHDRSDDRRRKVFPCWNGWAKGRCRCRSRI